MTVPTALAGLINQYAQPGVVRWIGVRPERKATVVQVESTDITDSGLTGDHRAKPGKRAVTLIQWEHLAVIAAFLDTPEVDPGLLRRNIAVSGINILGLRNRTFRLGGVILQGTGLAAPCSRMEAVLGHGGYAAVRGHGGITASVIEAGKVHMGDAVEPIG